MALWTISRPIGVLLGLLVGAVKLRPALDRPHRPDDGRLTRAWQQPRIPGPAGTSAAWTTRPPGQVFARGYVV
jgi:hypothetical protein